MMNFEYDAPDPRRLPVGEGEAYRRRFRVTALLAEACARDEDRRSEVIRELLLLGVDALPELRAAAASDDADAASLARQVVRLLVPDEIGRNLAGGLKQEADRYPIELGAALLARLRYPDLPVRQVLGDIDKLTAGAAEHIAQRLQAPVDADLVREQALNVVFRLGEFWRRQGFRGNEDDYYDARNSWLPDVLKRRTGLPISLSVLFVALARRLGLNAEGIGLPYHFIARVEVTSDQGHGFVYLDPFHGARPLDMDDCRKFVEARGHDFDPEVHLHPVPTREILVRMCNNLLLVFDRDRKALEAERVATVLVHLTPADPVPLVIRAERRMRRKEMALAREDLLAALALDSDGPVGQAAAEHLKRLQFEPPF